MTRVLVTGATGFLGRSVVARLVDAGITVTAHGKTRAFDGVESIVGDLADADVAAALLGAWRWDAAVNLAGPVTSGNEDLKTGIGVVTAHERIALHVRRYAAHARIVHASSMTVYGTPERVDVDESHPTRPLHLYGLAKLVAEDVLLADPTLDAWILRLPGLFSEMRTSGALYHFCRAARIGDPIEITTPAPTAWNVLHVEDAADAIMHALRTPARAPQAINVSYDEPIDLVAVARLVAELGGNRSSIESAISHPAMRLVAERARALLGWNPPSLRTRIAQLFEAYAAA